MSMGPPSMISRRRSRLCNNSWAGLLFSGGGARAFESGGESLQGALAAEHFHDLEQARTRLAAGQCHARRLCDVLDRHAGWVGPGLDGGLERLALPRLHGFDLGAELLEHRGGARAEQLGGGGLVELRRV